MPAAGPPMPERSSSAGDSSDPAATTTRGALTTTRAVRPVSGSAYAASTPAARPFSTSTRSTVQRTTMSAPASKASCR